MRGLVASSQKWRPVFLTAACFSVEALTWWKSVPPRTDLGWGNDCTSVGHSWVRTFQLYVSVAEFACNSPDSCIFEEPMEKLEGGFGPSVSHAI